MNTITQNPTYTLFIDESGKSRLSDPGDIVYLCGVVINTNLHTSLSSYMLSLKSKSAIPQDHNIHAFDIFEVEKIRGKTHKIHLQHRKIDLFHTQLTTFIEGIEMQTFVVSLEKTPYVQRVQKLANRKQSTIKAIERYLQRSQLNDFLYETLVRKLVLQFGHFLETNNCNGDIVAESRRHGDHAVVNAFMNATTSFVYPENSVYRLWSEQSFDHIFGLTFQNKKSLSFGLEVADMFAWSILNQNYLLAHGQLQHPPKSTAHLNRIKKRITRVNKLITTAEIEKISTYKAKTLSPDLIPEFTKLLKEYKKN